MNQTEQSILLNDIAGILGRHNINVYRDELLIILEEIQTVISEALDTWVSVEERLPEEKGDYLTVMSYEGVRSLRLHHFDLANMDRFSNTTTHWQPLLNLPTESK